AGPGRRRARPLARLRDRRGRGRCRPRRRGGGAGAGRPVGGRRGAVRGLRGGDRRGAEVGRALARLPPPGRRVGGPPGRAAAHARPPRRRRADADSPAPRPPPLATPADGEGRDHPAGPLDEPLEELRVEGLTVHHPGSGRGVEGVDLLVRRGELVVLTGPVGAGKTTVLRALLGLVAADGGTVRWNGAPVPDPSVTLVPPRVAYL